tara:strand:- start:1537 stop:2142 length:606 start_codon:yes stop_codon:yes gene_type:complete
MQKRFTLLVLATLSAVPLAVAEEQAELFPAVCSRTFVDVVHKASGDIQVTTSFQAAEPGSESRWPVIMQTAMYNNGDVLIDREVGDKFIDDYVSCDIWYEEAHHQLVRDLSASLPISRAGDHDRAEVQKARECIGALEACEAAPEAWRFTSTLKSMSLDQFDRLIGDDPRVFYLKAGAYTGQVMLFDTRHRRLVPILEGGC